MQYLTLCRPVVWLSRSVLWCRCTFYVSWFQFVFSPARVWVQCQIVQSRHVSIVGICSCYAILSSISILSPRYFILYSIISFFHLGPNIRLPLLALFEFLSTSPMSHLDSSFGNATPSSLRFKGGRSVTAPGLCQGCDCHSYIDHDRHLVFHHLFVFGT